MKITDNPIKRLLTSWDDAIGKVLTSVDAEGPGYYDNFLVLRFGDEAILLSYGGEDNDQLDDEPDDISGEYSDDRKARVYFGIDSLAEYEAEEAAAYERLKKKFGQ